MNRKPRLISKIEYARFWRLNNPEKSKNSYTTWKQNNKEKVLCINRNRFALRRNAEGTHSAEDIQKLLERQSNLCNGCQITLTKYHVDHIHPISKGGSNWPTNLQILCPTCNTSKGNKTMDEWKSIERKAA